MELLIESERNILYVLLLAGSFLRIRFCGHWSKYKQYGVHLQGPIVNEGEVCDNLQSEICRKVFIVFAMSVRVHHYGIFQRNFGLKASATPVNTYLLCIYIYIIIIIGIKPLGRSGQRPELSQATGMALVCCILGKSLGVVCHCFPPYIYIYISINT
jgi:hypothetical protein